MSKCTDREQAFLFWVTVALMGTGGFFLGFLVGATFDCAPSCYEFTQLVLPGGVVKECRGDVVTGKLDDGTAVRSCRCGKVGGK